MQKKKFAQSDGRCGRTAHAVGADALHDTVFKAVSCSGRKRSNNTRLPFPPRLPSLPRFFHPSRLFSLRDPSYTHDSTIEIATGIAPHDSAMEIATGIAPASSRTRRPKLNTPAAPNSTHPPPQTPLTATQLPTHLHQSNHQSKFWTRGHGHKTFENSLLYVYPPIILLSHL